MENDTWERGFINPTSSLGHACIYTTNTNVVGKIRQANGYWKTLVVLRGVSC